MKNAKIVIGKDVVMAVIIASVVVLAVFAGLSFRISAHGREISLVYAGCNEAGDTGSVLDAADGTPADGSRVRVYLANFSNEREEPFSWPAVFYPSTTDMVGDIAPNAYQVDVYHLQWRTVSEDATKADVVIVVDQQNGGGEGYTISWKSIIPAGTAGGAIYLDVQRALQKIPVPISTSNTSTSITLSWNQIADEARNVWGYVLYRAQSQTGQYAFIDYIVGLTNTTYTDGDVQIGQTYYYKLSILYRGEPCPVESLYKSSAGGPYTVMDLSPPIITHSPTTSVYTNRSIQINATVTDNTGLKNISLWYRGVNGTQYNVSMSCIQQDKYSYQIPAQTTPGTLYYSIWATDNYNNTASHPETGNHTIIILTAAGNISGRVIDSVTEQGIQNTLVTLVQKSGFNSTTNSTGYYIIADVPEGTYTVRAEKTGYENNTRTNVQVVPGQTTTNVDVVLTSIDTTGPIILSTAPENDTIITTATPRICANYTGIDMNDVILLIDGINVTANAAITEANISYIPQDAFSDGAHSVYLEVKDAKGNMRSAIWIFIISTKGAISGIVKDANNNPVEGVTLTILGTGYSTTTNSDGHYTIANVSAGAYDIKAEMAGYIAQINTGIAVVANQQIQINFILSDAPCTIAGTVKDRNGNSIPGATVTAGGVVITTNSGGYYTITNISAGSYDIKAEKAGYESETKSISISGGDFKIIDFSLEQVQEESKRALIPSTSALGTVVVILGMIFIIKIRKKR